MHIESEEDGFWLVSDMVGAHARILIEDPERLYDSVKAVIGPWLRERDEARRTLPTRYGTGGSAYLPSDPKHQDFHSIHADLWDQREGK